jgi:hypothetical protein
MHGTIGLAVLLVATVGGAAEEFRFESVGGRFGFPANNRTRDLHQAEAVAAWNLPWAWKPAEHWRLQSRLEVTAGEIFGPGPDAFVGTVGPTLSLGHVRFPVALEIGVSPTMLSRQEIGQTDFGCLFQFTSHAGLNWDIGEHFRIGYRFQHMSDAGITDHNPGLNLHVFSASYRF